MSLQIATIGTEDLFRPTPPVRGLVDARWTPAVTALTGVAGVLLAWVAPMSSRALLVAC
jgi:hypothetical protein